ncbi:hypothetical protein AB0M57_19910 [Streptomyces sp. NPDC051597]|uniref:hypothetical protein n=1 Tax=Streptomyces sp. NPDC051597 TaxID=3155049 RepID=UPI0034231ECA
MTARQKEDDCPHRQQRALAVCAALAGALVMLWGLPPYLGPLYVLTGLSTVSPLLFLRRSKSFVRACLAVGVRLVAWGALGILLGMFLFWPSAVLLLLAAFGNPKRRPVAAKVMGGVGALVTAGALVGAAVFCWSFLVGPALAKPHTFRADAEPGLSSERLAKARVRLWKFGATDAYESESDEGSFLEVRFPDDLPEEQRAELKGEIGRLPGIRRVELCSVRDCG